jgi:hypothetical protein
LLFGHWSQVAEETTRRLGDESAGLFVYFYNDGLDILHAILDGYTKEERLHSLVFGEFTALFKELHWLHVLFLSGNYPIIFRNARGNEVRVGRITMSGGARAVAERPARKRRSSSQRALLQVSLIDGAASVLLQTDPFRLNYSYPSATIRTDFRSRYIPSPERPPAS